MNLVQTLNQYNDEHVFFCDPIKNNVMDEGMFVRILYSSDIMTLNGIYLLVNLTNVVCEKYYAKYKCSFNITTHREIIEDVKKIEESILKKYKTNKTPSYKIYEQLSSGHIKLFDRINNLASGSFILKISGVWETLTNYGLTYKFIQTNKIE